MMRSLYWLLLLSLPAAASETEIPVVGTDETGAAIESSIARSDYSGRLAGMLSSVNASVVPALRAEETNSSWKLRTVVVGVGISAELGIGPIVKAKIAPRFRLVYSNSLDPVLP